MEGSHASGERRMANNHGSWFDVDWQAVALFVGNASSAVKAAREVCDVHITAQILPNGTEWIELERNVPSGYCAYNLVALTQDADLAATSAGAADVWSFATEDGRSLRKAIDWLMPFATGAALWPHPQPERPDWARFFEVMRRASLAYGSAAYERGACAVLKNSGKTADYEKNAMNLYLPPAFSVPCE